MRRRGVCGVAHPGDAEALADVEGGRVMLIDPDIKPRIAKRYGNWSCSTVYFHRIVGDGASPLEAYRDWRWRMRETTCSASTGWIAR